MNRFLRSGEMAAQAYAQFGGGRVGMRAAFALLPEVGQGAAPAHIVMAERVFLGRIARLEAPR